MFIGEAVPLLTENTIVFSLSSRSYLAYNNDFVMDLAAESYPHVSVYWRLQ